MKKERLHSCKFSKTKESGHAGFNGSALMLPDHCRVREKQHGGANGVLSG